MRLLQHTEVETVFEGTYLNVSIQETILYLSTCTGYDRFNMIGQNLFISYLL